MLPNFFTVNTVTYCVIKMHRNITIPKIDLKKPRLRIILQFIVYNLGPMQLYCTVPCSDRTRERRTPPTDTRGCRWPPGSWPQLEPRLPHLADEPTFHLEYGMYRYGNKNIKPVPVPMP